MTGAAALDFALMVLSVAARVDDLVAQINDRRSAGQSDEEISEWIRNLAERNQEEAHDAVDRLKGLK